jgi:hypothetical protein
VNNPGKKQFAQAGWSHNVLTAAEFHIQTQAHQQTATRFISYNGLEFMVRSEPGI